MTGRKERKKKIQLCLWDPNPQPLAYMDKGTNMHLCYKGEPEVVGRMSFLMSTCMQLFAVKGVMVHCSFAYGGTCTNVYPSYSYTKKLKG